MATEIHPTALVADGAELGADVLVGPYCVIGPRVVIGDRTRLGPGVVVDGVTRVGADNVFVGQAVIGGPPQDTSYKGEPTELVVGDRNMVREFVTINCGTVKGGGLTTVGSECLFMACSHVAHDCEVGDAVHLANGALLAGHVVVENGAKLSGNCAAHPFVTIGAYSYAGGMARVLQDVPPFMLVDGLSARVWKVNDEGMRRAGFDEQQIDTVQWAYKEIYRSGNPRTRTLAALRQSERCNAEVLQLIEFLERRERGHHGRYRESLRDEFRRRGMQRILGEVQAS